MAVDGAAKDGSGKDGSGSGDVPVEALRRGLILLQILNKQRVTTLDQLHRVTGLPKSTLSRLLNSLVHLGFVTNDRRQGGYQITSMVDSLSCGYVGDPLVVEASRPWLNDFTRVHKWSLGIATYEGDAMRIRFTTSADSPIAPIRGAIGMRLNLVDHAYGRIYLAYCNRTFQDEAIGLHGVVDHDERAAVRRMLDTARANGFAERNPLIMPHNSNTLAVPVIFAGKVAAALGMTYYHSAVTQERKLELMGVMKQQACNISASMETLFQNSQMRTVASDHWPSVDPLDYTVAAAAAGSLGSDPD
ncbi:transcriptional regulator, IclR family [Albimonas donghaensis]|uniref:Transcriptional regulator, IclR family n=1 Tax=Albimonas donghaensis TaxID=356660 RepID=A0A1H2ZI08_9RHOB|nr:helix-turn-helix domain-containing protein [Albimonas donghaensis]SDX17070.1 transcriptional regulator, IclR family [Albimonas donghaensis]